MKFPMLISFLRKLTTDNAETLPLETSATACRAVT
jgi:hypothetical protein